MERETKREGGIKGENEIWLDRERYFCVWESCE